MNRIVTKRNSYVIVSIIISLGMVSAIAAEPPGWQTLRQTSSAFTSVARRAMPAVVSIRLEKKVKGVRLWGRVCHSILEVRSVSSATIS